MNSIIAFLTSKEIIVVYLVAVVSCLLYFIISMIDKSSYKRKRKQNTRELNRIVEEVNEQLENEKEEVSAVEEMIKSVEVKETPIYIEPVITPVADPVIISSEEVEIAPQVEVSTIEEKTVEEPTIEMVVPEEDDKDQVLANNKEEENLVYTDIAPNRTEAQEELLRLTKELEAASTQQNIDLTSYEEQQEKDAIISLDELMKKTKVMYENDELSKYEDEGNEPISLQDLEKKMQEAKAVLEEVEENNTPEIIEEIKVEDNTTPEPEKLVLDDFDSVKVKTEPEKRPLYQGFKSTPIISPVYGIESTEEKQGNIELENTANYEKLDEEIRKTNEFLMTLKELKKNLD